MTDFFGYERKNPGQYLLSSDYAAIYMANSKSHTTAADKLTLVQSTAVSYQHRVEPRFEAGSSEMYWLTGQALGEISIGRLVGERGFLDGFRTTAGINPTQTNYHHGVIGSVEFKAGHVDGMQDVLTFGGGVLRSAAWQTSAGSLEISEAVTISVASLQSKNMANQFASLLGSLIGGVLGTAVTDMMSGNSSRIGSDVTDSAVGTTGLAARNLIPTSLP